MIPLTDKENKFYEEQEKCHICQKEFCYDKNEKMKFKLYKKVRDHCHYTGKFRGAAHNICNLNYKVPQETPVVIHNGSRYDNHFLIKELAEKFKGEFECLGEKTEKYISLSVPIKKEHDNGNDKTITHKLKFIDTCRFMRSKLSDLVDNLSEINNKDCKTCIERKNIKSECEFIGLKNNRLNFRCGECNGTSTKSINEKFPNTYQFCNGDLKKFVLLLRKGVYPYGYMDSWERFNETSLPPKKDFYSELVLEGISEKDYNHAQKVFEEYCAGMGHYHDLYVQTDTSLLADVFEKVREKCTEIYGLDPSYFLSASGLAWQACLKKTEVKLELLTDYHMLLMVEEGIRGGMSQSIHRCAKANNKYMKNYDKSIESSYLTYLDANNLYGWAMSQKLPVNGFKWENDLSRFNEDFIKNYNENSDVGYFLEVDVEYPKKLFGSHKDLPFLPERKKLEKVEKLVCSIEDKEKYVIHIRALKQALNHGLILKDVHRVIKFNQEAWLKPYIDMNTKLRKEAKTDFEKDFFKLMNNSVFGKTMESTEILN